jgi:hypothetical protein
MRIASSLIALGVASVLLSGCFNVYPHPPKPWRNGHYSKVMTSDFEGRPIAEFIAEGSVIKDEEGFHFYAVQRRIFEPEPLEFHYPLGRPVSVQASNVISIPVKKPEWLARLDGDGPAAAPSPAASPCPAKP